MQPLPTFPLFENPLAERVFEQASTTCACCGQARGWIYTGPVYCVRDDLDDRICPYCIADGSAATRFDCTFNDATMYPYRQGTPQLTAYEAALVERRTPGYQTWHENRWMMCCGRACVYLGEADTADLVESGRWKLAAKFLSEQNTSELGWSDSESREFIKLISKGGSPAAYVFRCQQCSGLKAYWDCD